MNVIGITSVLFGLLIIMSRGMLAIAPATTLVGFKALIKTSKRARILGFCILPLGALMIWAGYSDSGYSDYSTLAEILMIIGCIVTAGTMFLLVIFPKVYIALFEALVPSEPTSDFAGWRVLGLIGVAIGALFIYFGLLAL